MLASLGKLSPDGFYVRRRGDVDEVILQITSASVVAQVDLREIHKALKV